MEQISTKKDLIINRKERVKMARENVRESGKKRRADKQEQETIIKTIHAKLNKSEATPNHLPFDENNKTILCSNGSPESKWNHGFLLSSSLSEHLTGSSSNLDDETTVSEYSRFRVPHGVSQNDLFSDEGESQSVEDNNNNQDLKMQCETLSTTGLLELENAQEKPSSSSNCSSSRQHPIPRLRDQTKAVNSGSFVSREHTKKWSQEETFKFYKGLELFGTDFSMISRLFPSRTRKMCKNKFRKEEKLNMKEIEVRLLHNRKMRMRRVANRIRTLREQCVNLKLAKGTEERIAIIKEARRARFDSFNSIDSYDITVVETIEDQLDGKHLF